MSEWRYQVDVEEHLVGNAIDEFCAAAGGWDRTTQREREHVVIHARATLTRIDAERSLTRGPGWRVPPAQRDRWPLYRGEAVTFTTEWGPVTVGRSLARIYDMDGWPDAATLEAMAQQQAVREGVSA